MATLRRSTTLGDFVSGTLFIFTLPSRTWEDLDRIKQLRHKLHPYTYDTNVFNNVIPQSNGTLQIYQFYNPDSTKELTIEKLQSLIRASKIEYPEEIQILWKHLTDDKFQMWSLDNE